MIHGGSFFVRDSPPPSPLTATGSYGRLTELPAVTMVIEEVSTKPYLSPREVLLPAIRPWKIPRPESTLKTGRRSMPLFITYASYSHSGVKGLVNKPSDRSGAV